MLIGEAGLRMRSIGQADKGYFFFFFLVSHSVVMGLFNNVMVYIDKMLLIFTVLVLDGRIITSSNASHHMKRDYFSGCQFKL